MDQQSKLLGISLVVLLGLVPAACSSTSPNRVRMSSLCKASGGTYSGSTCQPASNAQSAAQLCAAHGGVYMASEDMCEVTNSLLWRP